MSARLRNPHSLEMKILLLLGKRLEKAPAFEFTFHFLLFMTFLPSFQLFNLFIFHFFPFRDAISILGAINAQDSLLGSSKCGHFSLLVVFTFPNPQESLSVDGK